MFASKSLAEHLARGAVGAGALVGAVAWTSLQPWSFVAAIAIALVAFRGCPMCWSVGLIQTLRKTPVPRTCADGRCRAKQTSGDRRTDDSSR